MAKRVPRLKDAGDAWSTSSILSRITRFAKRCRLVTRSPRSQGFVPSSSDHMRFFRFFIVSALVPFAAISGRVVQRSIADEVQKIEVAPAKPNRAVSLRDRLVVGLQ